MVPAVFASLSQLPRNLILLLSSTPPAGSPRTHAMPFPLATLARWIKVRGGVGSLRVPRWWLREVLDLDGTPTLTPTSFLPSTWTSNLTPAARTLTPTPTSFPALTRTATPTQPPAAVPSPALAPIWISTLTRPRPGPLHRPCIHIPSRGRPR
jgi:hypothetical protein